MSDFNQIFIDSPILVHQEELATLCFNNGKATSKTKYSLENHMLSLLEDTSDTISIFYSNGVANVYEFTTVLDKDEIELPIFDDNNKLVENLIQNQLLVFIDGILEPSDKYYVKDTNKLVLTHKRQEEVESERTHKIIVYASSISFEREVLSYKDIDLNNLYCPNYSNNKIMLFLDGIKIDFNCIEVLKTENQMPSSYIKLNTEDNKKDNIILEIIRFTNSLETIRSLNFESTQGYLTYGPYDDFGNKIPNLYNITFVLNDQAKIAVDDIRPGFIIKEVDGYGEAIIIDEIFETTEIHGIQLQPFTKNSYTKNEFYFQVPEYKSIVNYLAEFDNKFTFIPEILNIFQRLLLNEIQDTIQRLRNSRSIQKVDSTQINKLLQLLGCNLNTKRLNFKQRKELIEELNEFYRITGTRNSYNLLNILQNDLKLINIEQLFTPFADSLKSKTKTVYYYNTQISNGGSGYKKDDIIRTYTNTNKLIEGIVTDVDAYGTIINNGFKPIQDSGYVSLTGYDLPLSTGINDVLLDVKSTEKTYRYDYTISNSSGYAPTQELYTADNKFLIHINAVDANGTITDSTITPTTGTGKVSLNAVDLILKSYAVTVKVNTAIHRRKILGGLYLNSIYSDDTYNYNDLVNGEYNIRLEPGIYKLVISGGGGSGGSGDSSEGAVADVATENGYAGELKSTTVYLSSATTIKGKIGQGGGEVYTANTSHRYPNGVKGNGYQVGSNGGATSRAWTEHHGLLKKSHHRSWIVAGGIGGGSSSLQINGELIVAKGGNGGNAGGGSAVGTTSVVAGGIGGSGGTKAGTGAAGGKGTYGTNNLTSTAGTDGYIEIIRYNTDYTATISGDTDKLSDGEILTINTNNQKFLGRVSKSETATTIILSPSSGISYINETGKVNVGNDTAKLTVKSVPIEYTYSADLHNVITDYLKIGDEFSGTTGTTQFKTKITNIYTTSDGKKEFAYSFTPVAGAIKEEKVDIPVTYKTGTGATINVVSNENQSQSTADRCYIDFKTREELGAKKKKEYRIDKIDYGVLTEGTPKSPSWWIVGEPDIDYGFISEETKSIEDLQYGFIRDKIKGEWVEWWEWDRDPQWYPTNHIVTEIKMPTDTDFKEFTKTFVEQFYKLASAVVYIHSIVESFYFGANAAGSGENNKSSALFGIATGAPVMQYEFTVTSDPNIQYIETIPSKCKLTIIPTPADATVTLESAGETVTGIGTCSMTVDYGRAINWTVEKEGYISYSQKRYMKEHSVNRVVLKPNM